MARLTRDEFTARIQAIGTCEDDAERRTLLANLSEDGGETFEHFATIETERDTARSDNEKLRKANMELFLKVGDHPKEKPEPGGGAALKFEDLFDDKGGIK